MIKSTLLFLLISTGFSQVIVDTFEQPSKNQLYAPLSIPLDIKLPDLDFSKLSSLPSAEKVLFIDVQNVDKSTLSKADSTILNTWKWMQWNFMSEDLSPFSLNVTTDKEIYDQTHYSKKMVVLVRLTEKYGSLFHAGLCRLNSFGDSIIPNPSTYCNATVSPDNVLTSVPTHEASHGLGLSHDGRTNPVSKYHNGNRVWYPIMGSNDPNQQNETALLRKMSHFSKGDYPNANNTEDDFSVINKLIPFREDDHSNIFKSATILRIENNIVKAKVNSGIIENENDIDVFTFETSGGNIDLTVSPLKHFNNLHAEATLKDENGNIVFQGKPYLSDSLKFPTTGNDVQSAGFDFNSKYLEKIDSFYFIKQASRIQVTLNPGKYYLEIKNTSVPEIYSKYGSIGYYQITGIISNAMSIAETKLKLIQVRSNTLSNEVNCEGQIKPTLYFQNIGSTQIDSFKIEMLVDGVIINEYTIKESLDFDIVYKKELPAITNKGYNKKLIIKATKINKGLPQNTIILNNELVLDYNLGLGKFIEIEYSGVNNDFDFKVLEGDKPLNLLQIQADKYQGCLQQGCHTITASNVFHPHYTKACSNVDQAYDNNKTYSEKDVVFYKNSIYSAKWYIDRQVIPGISPGWDAISNCIASTENDYFSYSIEKKKTLIQPLIYDNDLGINDAICVDKTTIPKEENTSLFKFKFTDSQIEFNHKFDLVQIFDISGKLVINKNNSEFLDINQLNKGSFIVRLYKNNKIISQGILTR